MWTDLDWWELNVDKAISEELFRAHNLPFSGWINRRPVFSSDIDYEHVQRLCVTSRVPSPVGGVSSDMGGGDPEADPTGVPAGDPADKPSSDVAEPPKRRRRKRK